MRLGSTLFLDCLYDTLHNLILLGSFETFATRRIQSVDEAFDLAGLISLTVRCMLPVPPLIVLIVELLFAEPWTLDHLVLAQLLPEHPRPVVVTIPSVVKVHVAITTRAISTSPRHMFRPTNIFN